MSQQRFQSDVPLEQSARGIHTATGASAYAPSAYEQQAQYGQQPQFGAAQQAGHQVATGQSMPVDASAYGQFQQSPAGQQTQPQYGVSMQSQVPHQGQQVPQQGQQVPQQGQQVPQQGYQAHQQTQPQYGIATMQSQVPQQVPQQTQAQMPQQTQAPIPQQSQAQIPQQTQAQIPQQAFSSVPQQTQEIPQQVPRQALGQQLPGRTQQLSVGEQGFLGAQAQTPLTQQPSQFGGQQTQPQYGVSMQSQVPQQGQQIPQLSQQIPQLSQQQVPQQMPQLGQQQGQPQSIPQLSQQIPQFDPRLGAPQQGFAAGRATQWATPTTHAAQQDALRGGAPPSTQLLGGQTFAPAQAPLLQFPSVSPQQAMATTPWQSSQGVVQPGLSAWGQSIAASPFQQTAY